jgi:hypothetical protein
VIVLSVAERRVLAPGPISEVSIFYLKSSDLRSYPWKYPYRSLAQVAETGRRLGSGSVGIGGV